MKLVPYRTGFKPWPSVIAINDSFYSKTLIASLNGNGPVTQTEKSGLATALYDYATQFTL